MHLGHDHHHDHDHGHGGFGHNGGSARQWQTPHLPEGHHPAVVMVVVHLQ